MAEQQRSWMDSRGVMAIVAICVGAAIVCGGILWSGAYLEGLALADERSQATKEARLTREAFEIHSLDLVNYVDAHLLALRAAYVRESSFDDARRHLDLVPFDRSVIDDLAIVTAEGQLVLWSGSPELKSIDVSDREYFTLQKQARTDQIHFSPVELGRISGKQLFRMSRPIHDAEGAFVGLVLASVDPYSIARFYQDLRIGRQSTTSLIGTADQKLRARFPEPAKDQWGVPADSPLWAVLQKAAEGQYEAVGAIDGVQRTHVYKKLDKYPLVVSVGFSEQDVLDRVVPRQQRQRVLEKILIVAVLGITVLLIVITVNRQRLASANRDLHSLYEQVRGLALFDALTGLPNRSLLDDRLAQALRDAERNQEACALIYLDLDDFKLINDRDGHDAGDHVLAVTASRMVEAVRSTDTVSRRGGDEFVILLPHAGTLPEILEIADRLIQWVAEPITYNGNLCQVSASVGVAIYPGDGDNVVALLKAADEAMYSAKRHGKNKLVLAADVIHLNEANASE